MRPSIVVFPLLFAACAAPLVRGELVVRERRLLATIPADVNVVIPAAYSRDGRHAAYVAQTTTGAFAVCDDWASRTYAVV